MLERYQLPARHDGRRPRERGVAMLEALITIVILAFGILGLAGLQAKMQAAEMESYQRSQALVLLDDMAYRLSANRSKAANYVTASAVGTGDAEPADCSAKAVGKSRDMCEWSNGLKGRVEKVGAAAVGSMIDGRGCIEAVAGADPPAYRIVVVWQGLTPTVEPAYACGQGSYGGNGLRRAVAKVVSIANLIPPGAVIPP
jgi:type IV pilus assembly protein PilV